MAKKELTIDFSDAMSLARANKSSALIVWRAGELLTEEYWEVSDGGAAYWMMNQGEVAGQPLEDVASLQKSIVSYLVGVAVEQSNLDIQSPVSDWLGQGWSETSTDQEGMITVRHLLTMTSGLDTDLEFEAEPGTKWRYNTNAYSLLLQVLEKVTGQEIDQVTRDWLLEPAGMTNSGWYKRKWAVGPIDANQWGFKSTAQDLLRFGQLLLAAVESENLPLVNHEYLREALGSSQTLNPAYGYLFWLNNGLAITPDGNRVERLVPTAPNSMFSAEGALGRSIYVLPEQRIIVVRIGAAPVQEDFKTELWSCLSTALNLEHSSSF